MSPFRTRRCSPSSSSLSILRSIESRRTRPWRIVTESIGRSSSPFSRLWMKKSPSLPLVGVLSINSELRQVAAHALSRFNQVGFEPINLHLQRCHVDLGLWLEGIHVAGDVEVEAVRLDLRES